MTNRTYTDLLATISALGGVDSYSTNDQARVLALANRRLRMAYDASRVWPRYLVVAEQRALDENQVIPYSQDSAVTVSGLEYYESTVNGNGIYQPVDTLNSRTRYYLNANTNGPSLYWNGSLWLLDPEDGSTPANGADGALSPWLESAWENVLAEPTVAESTRAEVSEFIRVHRVLPYQNRSSVDYSFYVSSDGAHVMQLQDAAEGAVYVTYKTVWDGPFAADSTEIPGEFFNYVAHAVYADMVRTAGQADKALAEEAAANEILALELQRAEQLANNSPISTRIQTHGSRQYRYY